MIKYETSDGDLIVHGIEDHDDVIFTSGKHGAFNVTRAMLWALEHGEKICAQIDVAHTLAGLMKIDLDIEHLIALNAISDNELQRLTVLLYVDLGDGTHMLIDGNHRLAALASRAARAGQPMIECHSFSIKLREAEQFRVRYFAVVDGVEHEIDPEIMLDQMTGVYSKPDGSFEDRRAVS